ncbi:polyamine-transporting ATPase 13A3-like [Saccoglossus kowalevskii]|uniref:Cation-transporting ATPase n=1 Tax=Saccoglossus kowalevskii TaxID=10224 RepID=A0ABM0MHX7_SACKO|nr:PREDICTED: probable cation-transporting ATPase 13A3-like [Saccoglossus kowalevskii]
MNGNTYKRVDEFSVILNANCEDELLCTGYRSNRLKTGLCYVASFFTVGILILVFHWKPSWSLKAKFSKCPVKDAEIVLLQNSHGELFTEKLFTKFVAESGFISIKNGVTYHHRRPSSITSVPGRGRSTSINSATTSASEDDDTVALLVGNNKNQVRIKYFCLQKVMYLWDPHGNSFEKLHGLDKDTLCANFYDDYHGFSEEEQSKRLAVYGKNSIDVEVKSYAKLLFEEILNPFYIFQIWSVILWMAEEYYYYSSCIIFISVLSIGISLYETRRQSITLRNMVAHSSTVQVCREDQSIEEINGEFLVPGDVIIIPSTGCIMNCDAVLVGGNCIVNESMLTGESVPVTKTPLPHSHDVSEESAFYNPDEHKRHTLFCGTHIIQTRYYGSEKVKAVVVRTGFSTAKGELVRSILYPKPLGFKFYKDAMKFIGVLAILALLGFAYTLVIFIRDEVPVKHIIFKALDIFTIVVPPALPAAMTVGTVYAQNRLKRRGIFCISPPRINVCGNIKLFCFDKTGTLTEDGLDLWGVVQLQQDHLLKAVQNVDELPRGPFLAGMATCHSLTMIDGNLTGDPLDLKMFEATNWLLEEPGKDSTKFESIMPTVVKPVTADTFLSKDASEIPYEIGIVRQFPFSSSLQRMSVITRTLGAPNMDVYVKGSPEMISSLCQAETVPDDFHEVLHKYTEQGFRVIALAWKPMKSKFSWHQSHRIGRTEVECELIFLGLLIMQNTLKPETTPIIQQLKKANIRTVMVTGDNMLTAISVAKDCGMIETHEKVIIVTGVPPMDGRPASIKWNYEENPILKDEMDDPNTEQQTYHHTMTIEEGSNYHFAVSGKSFGVIKNHFPQLMSKIVVKGCVFARMAPDQKSQLVEALQEIDYIVGMCGDGANDCGALKTAHAGISLSEAEASVASPFTSNTPNITCVPKVIREGRAALVTSFGVFKYMALYSMVQFISVLILYYIQSNLGDMQFLYVDLVITTTVAVFMGRTEAYPLLVAKRPSGSLVSAPILFSLIVQVLIQVFIQAGAYFCLLAQPWFVPLEPQPNADENILCFENTVIFLISSYQYIILAAAFSKGRPYRLPLYTNILFMASLVLLTACTIWLTLYPTELVANFMQLMFPEMPFKFRCVILAFAAGNLVASFFIEDCLVDSWIFKRCIKSVRCKKASKNKYKTIERELMANPSWPPINTFIMSSDMEISSEDVTELLPDSNLIQ